jgi:hypothetical protein
MRFCQHHQLQRTRRILTDTQAGIDKANRPNRRRHKFTDRQLQIARESLERQQDQEASKP